MIEIGIKETTTLMRCDFGGCACRPREQIASSVKRVGHRDRCRVDKPYQIPLYAPTTSIAADMLYTVKWNTSKQIVLK